MDEAKYYVSVDGRTVGPATAEQVVDAIRAGKVTADALIAIAGTEEWYRIGDYSPFAAAFGYAPSAPAPTGHAPSAAAPTDPGAPSNWRSWVLPSGIAIVLLTAGAVAGWVKLVNRQASTDTNNGTIATIEAPANADDTRQPASAPSACEDPVQALVGRWEGLLVWYFDGSGAVHLGSDGSSTVDIGTYNAVPGDMPRSVRLTFRFPEDRRESTYAIQFDASCQSLEATPVSPSGRTETWNRGPDAPPVADLSHRCPTPLADMILGEWVIWNDPTKAIEFVGRSAGIVGISANGQRAVHRGTYEIGQQKPDGGYPVTLSIGNATIHLDLLTSRGLGDCRDLLITVDRRSRGQTLLPSLARWVRAPEPTTTGTMAAQRGESERLNDIAEVMVTERATPVGCRHVVYDPAPPLNVRADPSSRGPIVGTLTNHTVVTVGRARGSWIRVETPIAGWAWRASLREECP